MSEGIINSLNFSNLKICIKFIKETQTNIRKIGANKSLGVLELVHIDIYGSFPMAYWNGQQYFITFIDDYSHYGYLYLIHEKSQSFEVFKSYKAEVENQLGKKIKVVQSICGGVDMMDQVNNVQALLQDTYRNVTLFLNIPCQGFQVKTV